MALFADPFDALSSLQQALDTFRSSGWLASGPSGGGSYPPMNVFRKGDDFYRHHRGSRHQEVGAGGAGERQYHSPGRHQIGELSRKGERCIAGSGLPGRFDRAVTLPVEIDPDGVKAEYHDGILALFLPRAERDKPRSIQVA